MSQMLADEEWEDDEQTMESPEPFDFEDYKKQVEEILRAEQEELLETQAILNAPPGANSLDVPHQEDEPDLILATNTTDPQDDLAVLEMDAPTNSTEKDCTEDDAEGDIKVDSKSSTLREEVSERPAVTNPVEPSNDDKE